VPRRKANRYAGKHFFFEKKKQKTLMTSASVRQERPKPNSQKFCGAFFSKKNRFLLLALACRWTIQPTGQLSGQLKKRSKKLLIIGAGLTLCTAAVSPPRLVPSRDVTVEYSVHAPGARDQSVRVSIAAGGAHLRITGEALPVTLLVDRPAGTARVLVPLLRAYASLPIGRYDPERTVLHDAHFTRGAGETLAAGRCTDWTARSKTGTASACITDDGVILKGAVTNHRGEAGAILATSVDYAPLAAGTFAMPPKFHDLGELPLDQLGLSAPR
jgi:hypothetical protein